MSFSTQILKFAKCILRDKNNEQSQLIRNYIQNLQLWQLLTMWKRKYKLQNKV